MSVQVCAHLGVLGLLSLFSRVEEQDTGIASKHQDYCKSNRDTERDFSKGKGPQSWESSGGGWAVLFMCLEFPPFLFSFPVHPLLTIVEWCPLCPCIYSVFLLDPLLRSTTTEMSV